MVNTCRQLIVPETWPPLWGRAPTKPCAAPCQSVRANGTRARSPLPPPSHRISATRAGGPALGQGGLGDRHRGVSSSRISSARWRDTPRLGGSGGGERGLDPFQHPRQQRDRELGGMDRGCDPRVDGRDLLPLKTGTVGLVAVRIKSTADRSAQEDGQEGCPPLSDRPSTKP
jgi:hypothetical protein